IRDAGGHRRRARLARAAARESAGERNGAMAQRLQELSLGLRDASRVGLWRTETGAHEVRLHRERADVLALSVREGLPARGDVLPRRGQRAALATVARVHARAEHVVDNRLDGVRRGPADARSGRARAARTVARAGAARADVRPAIAAR